MSAALSNERESDLDVLPPTESWWKRRGTGVVFAVAALLFAIAGLLSLVLIPRGILSDWFPNASDNVRAVSLWPAAQIVLFALGGCIAIAGVALSGARHGEELRAADRDRERARLQAQMYQLDRFRERNRLKEASAQRTAELEAALRDRLVTAVELLASETAATKRMTGLYILAGLVDDWLARSNFTEAQVCVNVMCGYLRSSPATVGKPVSSAEVTVRSAGFELIRSHLLVLAGQKRAAWTGLTFNLENSTIDFPINLTRISLTAGTVVNFERAVIVSGGRLLFVGAQFANSALLNMNGLIIRDGGALDVQETRLHGGARILCSDMLIEHNGVANFAHVHLRDDSEVILGGATITKGGALRASGLRVSERAKLTMNRTSIGEGGSFVAVHVFASHDAYLAFGNLTVRDGGRVNLGYISVEGNALVTFARPSIRSRAQLSLGHSSIDGSRGVVVSDATIETGARVTFGSGLLAAGTLEISIRDLERGGRLILDGIRLMPGAELHLHGAHSDGAGRVWMFADSLTDARAVFLGQISLEGGALAE